MHRTHIHSVSSIHQAPAKLDTVISKINKANKGLAFFELRKIKKKI